MTKINSTLPGTNSTLPGTNILPENREISTIPKKVQIRWLKTKTGHIPGEVLEVEKDLATFLIVKGDAELL